MRIFRYLLLREVEKSHVTEFDTSPQHLKAQAISQLPQDIGAIVLVFVSLLMVEVDLKRIVRAYLEIVTLGCVEKKNRPPASGKICVSDGSAAIWGPLEHGN